MNEDRVFTKWHGACWVPEWINREGNNGEKPEGPVVMMLQIMLMGMGFYTELIDGVYNDETATAVENLQLEILGFTEDEADGNFGQTTRRVLFEKTGIDFNAIPRPSFVKEESTMTVDLDGNYFAWPPTK